jgi:ABC-type amino acid transport system permease subunit
MGWLVSGLELTLFISLAAWSIALALGAIVGILAQLPSGSLRALTIGVFEITAQSRQVEIRFTASKCSPRRRSPIFRSRCW